MVEDTKPSKYVRPALLNLLDKFDNLYRIAIFLTLLKFLQHNEKYELHDRQSMDYRNYFDK